MFYFELLNMTHILISELSIKLICRNKLHLYFRLAAIIVVAMDINIIKNAVIFYHAQNFAIYCRISLLFGPMLEL